VTAEDGRPALAGVRVLDLAHIVAGPTMGRILAELGADVVKVNRPADPGLDHYNLNRGKRTVILDLGDEADHALFDGLLDRADVVLHSFSPGTMERMGYPSSEILARKPGAIVASLTAYSDRGPWAKRRGYEHQGQATSGMMARYAGLRSPEKQTYVVNDHGGGLLGAFGAVVAIYARNRSGAGAEVKTSLAQIALLHQAIFAVDYEGRESEPAGTLAATGWGPDQRLYHAKDGMVFIGGQALDPDLVATLSTQECIVRFSSKTCGVSRLSNLEQIRTDPLNWDRNRLARLRVSGRGTPMSVVAPVVTRSRTPLVTGWFPNPPGADRESVAADLELVEPRWVATAPVS
jgi:crotonobetainyl-CoA:carnitine CoA-transferase CaiB-like acyl-CoA transferase